MKKSYPNGGIVEQLCCVALGGIVMIVMLSMITGLYRFLTSSINDLQTEQTNYYKTLDEVI